MHFKRARNASSLEEGARERIEKAPQPSIGKGLRGVFCLKNSSSDLARTVLDTKDELG